MDNAKYVEPAFGVDQFGKTRIMTGWEAIAQSILVVLFGKPGCYPSIPELGLQIQRYRYVKVSEIDADIIKAQLAYQCRAVYDDILNGDIDLIISEPVKGTTALLIIIPIEVTEENKDVVVGVQMNEKQIKYNYELIPASVINNMLGRS